MSQSTASMSNLIAQLQHKSSPKRRSAAKKLRQLKAKEAGAALLTALKTELKNRRAWETQYQMIMALGESEYTNSFTYLVDLTNNEFEATMVYLALGDAITRLDYAKNHSIYNAVKLIDEKQPSLLIDGIIRAIAMLNLTPSKEVIDKIIAFGSNPNTEDNNRTWIAYAAIGWNGKQIDSFLKKCLSSNNQQTIKAAEAALNKKRPAWSIL